MSEVTETTESTEIPETTEEILEKRIAELEKKIFGLEGKPSDESLMPESTIIESMEQAQTMISSALSGREKLSALMERLPELEEYENAVLEPTDPQIDVKLEYILAMESEIRQYVENLKTIKELMPVLDSNRFDNLPEMAEKLTNLSLQHIELGDQVNTVDSATKELMTRYNNIITNISQTLIALDTEITKLEKEKEPKKVID
ncbi:dynactin subunit 3 [Copidosoma floridanum]|uniref:dynactin subunit 3 n=1 Tax=Copidosoma floridanum TaxID=29053 RepID=UPI0006C991BE|nr:dynactin subunit 3 [Copidosoma floridanum]